VAFRDSFRSSYFGLLIRSTVVVQVRRQQRLAAARRLVKTDAPVFTCPVCNYSGPFIDHPGAQVGDKPSRRYAACADCGALERHRLQVKVLDEFLPGFADRSKSVLHFAPESFIGKRLKQVFGKYQTADLFRRDVNIRADICALPVPDASYDLVYASHVLEHVPDDGKAIAEIYRVLKPGGVAILPVPIYSTDDHPSAKTVEYGQPKKEEDGHVRAPGLDYFDRYRKVFAQVDVRSSDDFPAGAVDNQLYIRPPSAKPGVDFDKLPDFVPVCRKAL